MDHRLSRQDVIERIKDHGPNHYAGLYNVMKGVTLAGAGIAFVKLAGDNFPLSHIALMAVALTGVLLTYYGQSVGLIIVHLRPSILDITLPMALTVVEFFIVYRPSEPATGDQPIDWFWAFSLWAALAAAIIASVAWRIRGSNYSPALRPIVDDYRSQLVRDVGAASALSAGSAAFILAYGKWDLAVSGKYVFLTVAFCTLIAGINSQGKARRALARNLVVPV